MRRSTISAVRHPRSSKRVTKPDGLLPAADDLCSLLQRLGHRQPRVLLELAVKQALPSSQLRSRIEAALSKIRSYDAVKLARTVLRAFQNHEQHRQHPPSPSETSGDRRNSGYELFYRERLKAGSTTKKPASVLNQKSMLSAWQEMSDEMKVGYERRAKVLDNIPKGTLENTVIPPAISDSSDNESILTLERGIDADRAFHDLWGYLVEALHLEIVGRVPSILGGRLFQLHRLSAPVVETCSLRDVRRRIENEFLSVQNGCAKMKGKRDRTLRECRVYATQPKAATLWIQINLGSPQQKHYHGAQKAKRFLGAEYHVVLRPGGTHVAVACAGPAAKDRTSMMILASLDAAVTCGKEDRQHASKGFSCLQSISGPDPLDLLRTSASDIDSKALGRFSLYHSQVNAFDPVSAFDSVANGNLRCRGKQGFSQQTGVVNKQILRFSESGVILDHTGAAKQKRKLSHVGNVGRSQDCPKRSRLRWSLESSESTALSAAASSAWYGSSHKNTEQLPPSKFKCRVVLQGQDVFAGLRVLAETGEVNEVLPDYVRDTHSVLGTIDVTGSF